MNGTKMITSCSVRRTTNMTSDHHKITLPDTHRHLCPAIDCCCRLRISGAYKEQLPNKQMLGFAVYVIVENVIWGETTIWLKTSICSKMSTYAQLCSYIKKTTVILIETLQITIYIFKTRLKHQITI